MQTLWMIVASICFACMGVCIKLAAATFSSGELVFYRGLIGMAAMTALAHLNGVPLRTPLWRLHLMRGLSGSIALLFLFYAITVLPLATATTLNYTSPLFLTILLIGFYDERPQWRGIASILLGFVGVALLLQPTFVPEQWPGAVSGLLSGMLASVAYLSVRMLGRSGEPETRTVFWFSVVTTLTGLPWLLSSPTRELTGVDILLLLGVGGFAAAAQMALTRAYRLGKTLLAASLSYTTVIFACLFGLVIWQESLTASSIIAIALIICSGIVTSLTSNASTRSG